MELKLEVYNPALELLGLLEIQRSVIWESKAFGAGSFSLESLITEESRALLVPENIIWIEGDTAGVIEHIEQQAGTDGPYITVKGRDLTGLLDRRILWGLYDLNATPPAIMRYLVQDNAVQPTRGDTDARKIPGLVLLDAPAGGQSIRYQKTGGSLLDALELLGEAYQVAFGVRFNAAVPRMEFWTRWGVDRSVTQSINDPVFYSTELDDVLESEYSYDSANYRNISLVAGEGEGADRIMVTVEGSAEAPPEPPAPPEPVQYTVTLAVDPAGGGLASGGGTVNSGATVTVTAAPASGYEFVGWREDGTMVSADAKYTFKVEGDRSLTAVFAVMIPKYTITVGVSKDQEDWGSVSGGGIYEEGQTVTVTAVPADGYQFVAWEEDGVQISSDVAYTFFVIDNRELKAVFMAVILGVNWSSAPMPTKSNWRGGTYGKGKFVIVVQDGPSAAYSEDGITWTRTTLPSASTWCGVAYGNGKFITVARGSAKAAYSEDGVVWTAMSIGVSGSWKEIIYADGKFIAISNTNAIAVYSIDGVSWTSVKLPSSDQWASITYGDGKFVAIAFSSSNAIYSEDGITWHSTTLPLFANWQSVTYGNGMFVAVAQNKSAAAYSYDGVIWTESTMPSESKWFSIVYGDRKFVAVPYGGDNYAYSTDGINWSEDSLPESANWDCIVYGNNMFVVIPYGGNVALYGY